MTLCIVYLIMGIIVGMLIKYEFDERARKKRLNRRVAWLQASANDSTIKQYDEILVSIRSLNESLKQQKKEVQ